MPPAVSREELLSDLGRVARELGDVPTLAEYNNHGEYSQQVVYKHFDSYTDAKEGAGLDGSSFRISEDTLLDDVRDVAEKIGRVPPVEKYREHGNHSHNTLRMRFGNWATVLQSAGFESTDHSQHWEDNQYEYERTWGQNATTDCDQCGETFDLRQSVLEKSEHNFCSLECKGAYQSEQTGEDAWAWEGGKVEIACEQCGDTREVVPARATSARFCSQSCMLEWHKATFNGENHHRWRGGYQPYYGPNWREQRRKARERDDCECQVCGMGDEEHRERWGQALEVHHITRFGDFDDSEQANQLDNLVTLCRKHHALVEAGELDAPRP